MAISERRNRSDSYQYLICEVLFSDEGWQFFTNQDSIQYHLNPWQYDERLFILQDELNMEFWKLAKVSCTPRQMAVMQMTVDGYTQMEIAKVLNVNQSSIVKCLRGNTDYSNGGKVYGGVVKKMKKVVAESPVIQTILTKMRELQEEKL
jgi:Bacterial regulatory proteins, luxR family